MATEVPAIKSLKEVLRDTFPLLKGTYKEGIQYPRLQGLLFPSAPGKPSNAGNPHVAGLALDIFTFARGTKFVTTEQEEYLGDCLFEFFWRNHGHLGCTECIWKTSEMTNGKLPKQYQDGKNTRHKTHIHIDWANYSGVGEARRPIPNGKQTTVFPWYLAPELADLQTKFAAQKLTPKDPMTWTKSQWLDEIVIVA